MKRVLAFLLIALFFSVPCFGANEVFTNVGALKSITFANHGEYAPAASNIIEVGTPQNVDMDISGTATTAMWQSDKVDLGNAADAWATQYAIFACIEFFVAPTTGTSIDFYWGASTQATAANGNPGFLTGVDGTYTGTPATAAEVRPQLQWIGTMTVTADVEFMIEHVGTFSPKMRYGMLIIHNRDTGQTLAATDGIETAVVFVPASQEVQ